MKVIVDSNVWISFLLGFQKELMHALLTSEHIEVYMCNQLMHEIKDVASRPKIQDRINNSDVEQLLSLIRMYCSFANIRQQATISIRDRKDLYLLSFAETINADYIVSGDNDLLVLQEYDKTRIVSPAQFKLIM